MFFKSNAIGTFQCGWTQYSWMIWNFIGYFIIWNRRVGKRIFHMSIQQCGWWKIKNYFLVHYNTKGGEKEKKSQMDGKMKCEPMALWHVGSFFGVCIFLQITYGSEIWVINGKGESSLILMLKINKNEFLFLMELFF
jgi:hypothetical protein